MRATGLASILGVVSCDRSVTSLEEPLAGPAELSALGSNGLIVYTCEGGLATDICTLDPVSKAVVNLTNDGEFDTFPDWSPDASRIVFDSDRSTNQPNIHVMNADGTGITRISATPCCDRDFQPAWSPDGARIAFVSTRDGDGEYELCVMGAGGEIVGAAATRLTDDPAPQFGQGKNDSQATWSPDSRRLAFVSNRDPQQVDACDIYVMDAADLDGDGFGDNLLRLTFVSVFDCDLMGPAWSPAGDRIAFTSTHSNDYEVWVMNADGSNLVNVTNFPGQDFDAGWSPDGTQITFVSGRAGNYDIYSTPAPASGSGALTLAASPPVTKLTNNTTDDREPDWGVASGGSGGVAHTLTVVKKGRGRVTSVPAGVDCGPDCTQDFAHDTRVRLTARPAAGSVFKAWSGACATQVQTTCTFRMRRDRTVTATFALAP